MTTLTKTITIDLPDGTTKELDIELDIEYSSGEPDSGFDLPGFGVLNVRLAE